MGAGVEAGRGIGPDAAPPSPTKEFVDEIRSSGLSFCGFSKEKQERVKDERNEERFRSLFGVSALSTRWKNPHARFIFAPLRRETRLET